MFQLSLVCLRPLFFTCNTLAPPFLYSRDFLHTNKPAVSFQKLVQRNNSPTHSMNRSSNHGSSQFRGCTRLDRNDPAFNSWNHAGVNGDLNLRAARIATSGSGVYPCSYLPFQREIAMDCVREVRGGSKAVLTYKREESKYGCNMINTRNRSVHMCANMKVRHLVTPSPVLPPFDDIMYRATYAAIRETRSKTFKRKRP